MREKETQNRKYKLLVVDDEPFISDSMKELFETELGDIFEVFNCYHPKKALQIFEYRFPNLVVSDVKMPKMTGIEMAEKMRKIKPDVHVLFLSGYDEFELVYSAIKQNADDYILKTEGDATILAAVRKMAELIRHENLFMEEYESSQNKITYMEPVFKQQALVHILDGSIVSTEDFDKVMADLENPLPVKGQLLLLIGSLKEKVSQKLQENILETVEQMLYKAWDEKKIGYIHKVMYRDSFVWMLETGEEELSGLLFVTVLDIQKIIQQKLSLQMRFVIAENGVLWKELNRKYNDLWYEMQGQVLNEDNSVVMENRKEDAAEKFNGESVEVERIFCALTEKISLLEKILSQENFEDFCIVQEEILQVLENSRRHSMYALELYYSLGNMLVSYINRKNIRMELASRIQLVELFDPGAFETWKEAADYIRKLVQVMKELHEITDQNTQITINEKIKAYILSHLSEELSLTVIGQVMGFNPVYLSRVFKQYEHISIRDYIEKQRIELGMRLIKNSRLKIYEVAEVCGYQNPAYFIKIFKEHYGITPQECRKNKM